MSSLGFSRAKNMVVQDKFDFHQDTFSKDLKQFLSNYFIFDSLTVDVLQGKTSKLILYITVSDVKKSHVV